MVNVYIIQSKHDSGYYIGITKDIEKRILSHNAGKVSSTKKRRPFVLVYSEDYKDYKQARVREIELKSYKGGNALKQLLK